MVDKKAAIAFAPSLFLGGALFNVMPAPTDPLYFLMINWLLVGGQSLPSWEIWTLTVVPYYLLPALWYEFLFIIWYYASDELDRRIEYTGAVFGAGMVIFLVWDFGFGGQAFIGNVIPNAATVAGIAAAIVVTFAVLTSLVLRELFGLFEW